MFLRYVRNRRKDMRQFYQVISSAQKSLETKYIIFLHKSYFHVSSDLLLDGELLRRSEVCLSMAAFEPRL